MTLATNTSAKPISTGLSDIPLATKSAIAIAASQIVVTCPM